tara:strand:+ start:1998 stop:2648 length:651 start_codon:yes stop_codon:yes gene_type:complete
MINKIIHQVFWAFKGKELDEIDVFRQSVDETKRFCWASKYEYKMWNLKDCEELIVEKYPEYITLWTEFRFDIQRCDFIRYLILHSYGGWYVDCDVYPIQNLDSLSDVKQIFTSWNDDKDKKPYNAVMGSVKNNPLFLDIMNDIQNRVIEKQNIKIYDTWKGRLVFHTTGHHMLKRHVPKEDIHDLMLIYNEKKKIYTTSDNPYFYDNNASLWHLNS